MAYSSQKQAGCVTIGMGDGEKKAPAGYTWTSTCNRTRTIPRQPLIRHPTLMQAPTRFLLCTLLVFVAKTEAATGVLELRVVDDETGEPVAARLQLRDRRERIRPIPRTTFWHDHAAIDGKAILTLAPGKYTFSVERGPEYLDQSGHFLIRSAATDNKTIRIKRFTNMARLGWWSGDLYIDRPAGELDLLMRSEDLHVASVLSWSFDGSHRPPRGTPDGRKSRQQDDRIFDFTAGQDARYGGRALVFRSQPIVATSVNKDFPPSIEFLKQARRAEQTHISIAQPNAWDLPIWLASGYVDSFMLLGPELLRVHASRQDPVGLPRDRSLYPQPLDWGRWCEAIYYHILNCGLRIPPMAASGSGIGPNPLGYSRVYVHCGAALERDEWWNQLRAGRTMVTNGPLLITRVNGELPGHVFRGYPTEPLSLEITLTLHTRERIDYLEIVKNGRVVEDVRLADLVAKQGRLPHIVFERSGWLLVRAVTNNPTSYRVASTGPYYVQIGDATRISRNSARFFLDWLQQRTKELQIDDPAQRKQVLRYHRAADAFWRQLVESANAD